MRHVVIIGSGLAGLLTAIMVARRGFRVTIVEKDKDDLTHDPGGSWVRQGVGQASQTHSFLALSSRVLSEEAPDVLAGVERQGVPDLSAAIAEEGRAVSDVRPIFDRRLSYERVLRETVKTERRIELRLGETVTALVAGDHSMAPTIQGVEVRRSEGETYLIDADLVIDAAGRKSPVRRLLQQLQTAPLIEETHKCDFQYLTRWYHLKDGATLPGSVVRGRACFGSFLLCAAGGGRFSISLVMSADDPLRRLLRDGGRFDDFCSTVPRLAACLRLSVPTDEPIPFAGIENRRRKLIGSGGPVVGGYVLVGDSAMHTNPTLGRGTSLAFKQAQFVASNLDLAFADPTQFVADYANWQDAQIAHWFDSQVSADREHCERLRALAHGEPLPPLSSEGKIALAMQLLAATDPLIARAGARIFHMLQKPSEVLAGGDVEQKLSEFLACNPDLTEPREGAPRASLLQWP